MTETTYMQQRYKTDPEFRSKQKLYAKAKRESRTEEEKKRLKEYMAEYRATHPRRKYKGNCKTCSKRILDEDKRLCDSCNAIVEAFLNTANGQVSD